MRTKWMSAIGLMIGVALLGGCNNNLKEENALLTEENETLRAQLNDRNSALDAAHQDLQQREMRLAELQRQLANANTAPPSTPDPFGGIPGVKGSISAGEVTATVESDVLFDSGKATLKTSAKQSLDQVASVIMNQYGGRAIRVDGHTDTDPIKKSGYKSNFHLGAERAFAVREYLISRGVPSQRVYIASHGPNEPMGSKQQSRRVEIAVVLNE